MIQLKDQVCTLEQAKRFKDYGIEGKSIAQWRDYSALNDSRIQPEVSTEIMRTSHASVMRVYPAFTVTEMGAMIGKGTKCAESHWQWLLDCVNSGLSGTVAYNPVALAGFLITALEANIITAEAINKTQP